MDHNFVSGGFANPDAFSSIGNGLDLYEVNHPLKCAFTTVLNQMELLFCHRRLVHWSPVEMDVLRPSHSLGNTTPNRAATISGASRDGETANPCSRHALSPPSSTHTLPMPMRCNATATRALTISCPE